MIGTNSYFPAGQEDIDNLEEDLSEDYMINKIGMLEHLTDYAEEFGDQNTIELIQTWMKQKMGKNISTESDVIASKVKILREIMDELNKLNKDKSLDYTIAITDVMIVILQKMQSL